MKVQRRTNLLWGIIALALAIVLVLRALNQLPEGIYDLITRAWPALLIIGGLSILLRDRVPVGSLIALVVGVALVSGIAVTAYSSRSSQEQSDYTAEVNQPIGAGISLLRVQVETFATQVEIVRSLQNGSVTGEFVGSSQSLLETSYVENNDSTATLTIKETHPDAFPMLEKMGRGRFRLDLPSGIPLDVSMKGADGTISLNMNGLSLERLNLDLIKGDAAITLPEYKPLGSPEDAPLGALVAREGNITVFVPPTVAARLELNRGGSSFQPVYDATVYNYLVGDILEARNFDSADVKLRYGVTAPRGLITIDTTGSS